MEHISALTLESHSTAQHLLLLRFAADERLHCIRRAAIRVILYGKGILRVCSQDDGGSGHCVGRGLSAPIDLSGSLLRFEDGLAAIRIGAICCVAAPF
jgi:hypothetical protein